MTDSKPSGVRVKPLIWDKNDEALVVSRIYRVWKIHNSDKWLVNTNGYTLGGVLDGQYNRIFNSKAEAKVAAQNHYQAAIGEPIKPAQPDPVGYALAIEQAAEVVWSAHDEKDAAYWGFSPSDIARREKSTAIRALSPPADRLVVVLAMPEVRAALEASYLAGFNSSGEGYNGEYPFQDSTEDPEKDADWLAARSTALAALVQP